MIDYARYRTGPDDSILVLTVNGKLDNESSSYLFDCVEGEIEDGCTQIILDLEKLDHISSLGLGTLVRIHSRMRNKGGNVKFAHVDGLAAEVISGVGLNKLFHFHDTVEDACAAFED